jgi:hypothetical protein
LLGSRLIRWAALFDGFDGFGLSKLVTHLSAHFILQAFLSYFDIVFDCNGDETVYFSTGPEAIPTHWQQTVFFLEEPVDVKPGAWCDWCGWRSGAMDIACTGPRALELWKTRAVGSVCLSTVLWLYSYSRWGCAAFFKPDTIVLLRLRAPLIFYTGTVVQGRVRCARTEDNERNLMVHLTYSVQPLDESAGPERSQSYVV